MKANEHHKLTAIISDPNCIIRVELLINNLWGEVLPLAYYQNAGLRAANGVSALIDGNNVVHVLTSSYLVLNKELVPNIWDISSIIISAPYRSRIVEL